MKKKAIVTIYSFVIYLVISLALIALVYSVASNLINKQQENFNFETMIESINILDQEITTISQNPEARSQITVTNPEDLEINCLDNYIYGRILYEQAFRDDGITIQNININRKHNTLEFTLEYENILLSCDKGENESDIYILNKGNNTINIAYKEYDVESQKVVVNIYPYIIDYELEE